MFNTTVIQHFQNPLNVGEIPDADGIGRIGNPACGDVIILYIKVEKGKLVDVKHKTFGCAAAIATSSIATELVTGKSIEEAIKITKEDVASALNGLPDVKMHCSNLAPDAIRAAIENYWSRNDL